MTGITFSQSRVHFFIGFLVAAIAAATVVWPMLRLRWDLVDDGVSFATSHLIENAVSLGDPRIAEPVFLERHFVRFRPVYWVWFWLIYHVFGTSHFIFHLIKVLFFIISALCVYTLIWLLVKHPRVALATALLYIFQLH